MKGVLLIGSHYGTPESANGICLRNIAEEYVKRGYTVYVISDSNDGKDSVRFEKGVEVHSLREAWYSEFLKKSENEKGKRLQHMAVSALRRLLLIPFYPNVSPLRSVKVYKTAKKIIEEREIDCVICSYRPFESLYAGVKLKRKYGEKIVVLNYHMDILSEPNTGNSFVRDYQVLRARRVLKKESEIVDGVILPKTAIGKEHNHEKTIFTDFPVYVPMNHNESSGFVFDNSFYNIAYIGTLNRSNRDPQYALDFFQRINKISEKKVMLHFWGKIENDILSDFSKYDWIQYHGYIENVYVMDILRRADLLLNITNGTTYNMLPSKVVQLFAAKRPVINFVKHRDDCSLSYFDKYGYVQNIFEDRDYNGQVEQTMKFILASAGLEIDFPENIVKESTPYFWVDLVEERYDTSRKQRKHIK